MHPGGVKTHLAHVIGAIEKNITLIITILHTLSADQMEKFTSANQPYSSVTAHIVDKVYAKLKGKYNALIARIRSLERDTTSTAFLLASPQFMANQPEFTRVLITEAHNRVLHLVVVDEVHLFIQQGILFCGDIYQLTVSFFLKVF